MFPCRGDGVFSGITQKKIFVNYPRYRTKLGVLVGKFGLRDKIVGNQCLFILKTTLD